MKRKGIILAGGTGSRLYPITKAVSKQLLPVFDKPMIYYPLSTLMHTGIREILIITSEEDIDNFKRLLGRGERFGLKLDYSIQEKPNGIAQALIIAKKFLNGEPSCLILGDNLFYGSELSTKLKEANNNFYGASILGYKVNNPKNFGVMEIDSSNLITSIEEKPNFPKSNIAVTGIYFYDGKAPAYAEDLIPSERGELEITDLNIKYLKRKELSGILLSKSIVWMDTGTHKSLLEAGKFVELIERKKGYKIACLEEIAFEKGWIKLTELEKSLPEFKNSSYGSYLKKVIERG